MSLTLERPPFRPGHRRTVSVRSIDTVLEHTLSSTPSSRPSTASTQSSFCTAFSSLEDSPFRYYLPHISTSYNAICTPNMKCAFNAPYKGDMQIHQVGRFYHYIPDLSGEEDDVYTDGTNIMYDTLRGSGQLHIKPEQKVLGGFKNVNYNDIPVELKLPLSCVGPKNAAYRRRTCITEAVDAGVGTYMAGEHLGSVVAVDVGKKKEKVSKERHKRSVGLADVSERAKELLRRLHLGKRAEKWATSLR